jgi:3-hydroxyacyl-CoA dehydrogenase
MKRTIKKVAVIGSGIMGSGIACHFANIGVEVLLLDIVPRETELLKKRIDIREQSSTKSFSE